MGTQGRRGNLNKQWQHVTRRMDIALKLLRRYRKPTISDTGKQIKYNVEKLKLDPNKLHRWYKTNTEQEPKTPGEKPTPNNGE